MKTTSLSLSEKVILGLVFLLANLRALVFIFLFPDTSRILGPAWIEIGLWMIASLWMVYLLNRQGYGTAYLALWHRNWLLGLFILLALLSILWTVAPVATLFRVLELLFGTLIASYFGMRLSPEKMMETLFWFGAILLILSIALVFGAPPTGTMYWSPFHGAWRGVFWHRNHLASIIAFLSAVYLFRILIAIRERNRKGILDAVLYLLSMLTLLYARSATGFIVAIVLHFFVLGVFLWLRVQHHLQKKHYLIVLGAGFFAGILVLANLDFVFGLFNRDATMTGRVGLWSQLLTIVSQRLWLGHGFGAVWTMDSFRQEVRLLAGWPSQPLIGDNGFIDILLHLGVVGLVLFLGALILVAVRSIRYAFTQKTLASFFPLLVVVYAIFANITFSLFAETEVFVWFLIVAVLFISTPVGETAKT